MTKTRKKRLLAVGLAAAVLRIAAFAVMAAKDQTYVPSDSTFENADTFVARLAKKGILLRERSD